MRLAAVRSLVRPAARPRLVPPLEPTLVVGYLGLLAAAVLHMARRRMYWFDELFTLHLARDPLGLWRNLAAGVDLNPPLSYLLTAASVAVFGEVEWAVRLPSIVGAVAGCGGLYLFVRRRRGPAEAFLAMTVVGCTSPVWIYFVEARPYGLAVGLTAAALVCYQRATEAASARWAAALAGCLSAGVWTHYYFVVPVAGLAVAEVVRSIATRTIDRRILLAFAASGLALAALYPLWGFAPAAYKAGFWAQVRFTRPAVEEAFAGLAAKELAIPLVAALVFTVIGARAYGRASAGSDYPLWEAVALAAVAVGPALGVWVGAKLTGGFYYRYVLPSVVGLSALVAFAVGRSARPWAVYAAAGVFAVTGVAVQWKAVPGHFRAEANAVRETAAFLDAHAAGGDVYVESPFEFARLWHYRPGTRFAPRFVADPPLALAHTKADTIDRGVVALGTIADVPADAADAAAGRVRERPTYWFGPKAAWAAGELERRGVRFEKVAERANGAVYRLR